MRRYRMLAAATLVLLLVVLGAGAAFAQTATTTAGGATTSAATTAGESGAPLGADEQKCVDKLLAGGTVEDCPKKPNPIVPQLSEVIWGAAFFLVVALFMMTYAVPKLRAGVGRREATIRGDVDSGQRDLAEAEQVLQAHRVGMTEARVEANEIIDAARREAESVRQDLMRQAEADAAAQRAEAAEELRRATETALARLQGQVADLSIDLAERVVERPLDRAQQRADVEALIRQAGDGGR
jgi:F-type H+-transporting ATPase subunit b